eukprot:3248270-Prymnesium_polylepis.1
MREAAPTHSPQLAPEGCSNHQNRPIEARRCDPRPSESLPRLAASGERSGVHTDAHVVVGRLHNANPRS